MQAQDLNETSSFNLEIDENFGVKMVLTDKKDAWGRSKAGSKAESEDGMAETSRSYSLQDEQDALQMSFMQDEEIDSILSRIRNVIEDPREKKNYMLLLQTENICRALKGGRITSCKSAKDRTSMGITLEQTTSLLQHHNMRPGDKERVMCRAIFCSSPSRFLSYLFLACSRCWAQVLWTMRSRGVRLDNVEKNVGGRKYAFNQFQVLNLPRLYKPPEGTNGSVQS